MRLVTLRVELVTTILSLFAAGGVALSAPDTDSATRQAKPADVPLRPYPDQHPNPAGPLDFKVTSIDGEERDLRTFDGHVILLVNVASKCGLTPQYAGLQRLYTRYHDHKFVILAFPANDFLHQEPGTDEQIKVFATEKYKVTFPLMSKIVVKGKDQHPLYAYLTEKETGGEFAGPVEWNFAKFLVGREGKVVGRFPARMTPEDPKVLLAIESALGLTPEQVAKLPPLRNPSTRPTAAASTTKPAKP